MLTRKCARRSARWGMVLGLGAMVVFASAGTAQQSQSDKPRVTKPVEKAHKEQKASPEVQKARAEVKALHEQMHKLHEQMAATREKMHKAWQNLAKLEGRNSSALAARRGWRHRRGMGFASMRGWQHWHTRWMHGPWTRHWARFHDGGEMVRHEGGAGQAQEVNTRLQHLQQEIDSLRRQLQKQASPQRER